MQGCKTWAYKKECYHASKKQTTKQHRHLQCSEALALYSCPNCGHSNIGAGILAVTLTRKQRGEELTEVPPKFQ